MFQTLTPLNLNHLGDYTPIPLGGAGGVITIKIPKFATDQVGTYEVGIYEGDNENPGFIEQREAPLAPYCRYLSFQIPPGLTNPQLGLRLIQNEDLTHYDQELTPAFHLPPTVSALNSDPSALEWTYAELLPAAA